MNESGAGIFLTTRWTVVLEARGASAPAGEALKELCAAYYGPVTAFLRRSGRGEDESRDTAHGFFEWVLSRDPFASADPERGRFRSYLLGALKHYLSHERARRDSLKRGGRVPHESLSGQPAAATGGGAGPDTGAGSRDLPDPGMLPPDREFDRQWALHVLARALESLEVLCRKTPEEHARFQLLKPFLTGDAAHGGLARVAAEQGWPEATARSHLHRLRRQFRAGVRRAIAPTLDAAADAEGEMAVLLAALGGR